MNVSISRPSSNDFPKLERSDLSSHLAKIHLLLTEYNKSLSIFWRGKAERLSVPNVSESEKKSFEGEGV